MVIAQHVVRVRATQTKINRLLTDALTCLVGEALEKEPTPVHVRIAPRGDDIVIDLGTANGEVIIVNQDGWDFAPDGDVLFRRTALTAAFPRPDKNGDVYALRKLLNMSDKTFQLTLGWLLAGLIPDMPHAIAFLGGVQASGKSTAGEFLTRVIDPSPAPLRTQPKDIDDWACTADGSWCLCIDNVSYIPPWWSDALCKCVTGDGLIKRTHYTNSDLTVLSFRRVVMLTSIDAGALKGDLASRLLMLELDDIPNSSRRDDKALKSEFNQMQPYIFGGLLNLLVRVRRELPRFADAPAPRMADFSKVLSALDEAEPNANCSALLAYLNQDHELAEAVIESDLVGNALIALVNGNNDEWCGTPTELFDKLKPEQTTKGWPATPRALSGRLKRITPALAKCGITVAHGHEGRGNDKIRTIQISKHVPPSDLRPVASPTSPPSPTVNGNAGDGGDTNLVR